MIKFGIIGGGWRSEYFMRIVNIMPDRFSVPGVLMRNAEKGKAFSEKNKTRVLYDFDEFVKLDMDFVLVCCSWDAAFEMNKKLFAMGIPVLSETPPAPTVEALDELWEDCQKYRARLQVAEQYFAQPYYSALQKIIGDGVIDSPAYMNISMIHGYHAINIMRRLMGIQNETCVITGKRYTGKLMETCSTGGLIYGGQMKSSARDVAAFEFESGKVAHYDFDGEQYFSQIRTKFLRICADKGEIFNSTVKYIDREGGFAAGELTRVDLGANSNLEGFSNRGIQFNGKYVYRNPFEEKNLSSQIRLSDDEIAMAQVLVLMKRYVETGEEFYKLSDAFEDTYLSHCMELAMNGAAVQTVVKPWHSN